MVKRTTCKREAKAGGPSEGLRMEFESEITKLRKDYETWLNSKENREFEEWAGEQHRRIDRNLELICNEPLLKNAIPRK